VPESGTETPTTEKWSWIPALTKNAPAKKLSEISASDSQINRHSSPDDDRRNKDWRSHRRSLIRFITSLTFFLFLKGSGK
jgi:hypothetical protein